MLLNPAGRVHPSTPPAQSSPAQTSPEAHRDGSGGTPTAAGPRGEEPARPALRAAGRWGQRSAAQDQELHLVRRCSDTTVRSLMLEGKIIITYQIYTDMIK